MYFVALRICTCAQLMQRNSETKPEWGINDVEPLSIGAADARPESLGQFVKVRLTSAGVVSAFAFLRLHCKIETFLDDSVPRGFGVCWRFDGEARVS
jgi:hypothetical protein